MNISSSVKKITAPPLPVKILHRRALMKRLSEALAGRDPDSSSVYKLILVHAPAGYGKTTLLADTALQSSLPCCWYILDRSDREPYTFLRLLLASLQQRFPSFGEQLMPLLGESAYSVGSSYLGTVMEALITAMVNEIPERFALLLCNYQEVSAYPEITALVEYLLNHLPAQAVLVLESREVPDLNFASLLADRAMLGIGQDLLRFSSQEILELVQIQGSRTLSEEEAEQLVVAFDGWITGLLLGTRLGGIEFLQRSFTASLPPKAQGVQIHAQHLFSYVVNEIFKHHQQVYAFLKEAVVLQEMNPVLCAGLLGITVTEASRRLHYLERHGLFVTHSEEKTQRVYTCNPVLRDLLYEELRQQDPERFMQLHQRAAELLGADQQYERAIYHALEANADDIATRLILSSADHMIELGRLETLQHWITAFSETTTARYPKLLLILAKIYVRKSELHKALPLLEQIADLLNSPSPTFPDREDLPILQAELTITRAYVYIQKGEYKLAQKLCLQVLEHLPADEIALQTMTHIYVGACAQFLGDFTTKIMYYQKALQIGGRHTISYLIAEGHTSLATTYRILGNFALAEHHITRATACWKQLQNINGIVNNLIVLAEIKWDHGALSEAESLLQQALTLASSPLRLQRLRGYVLVTQGELDQDQALYERSLAATEEGLALARQLWDSYLLKYALMTLALTYLYMKDAATASLLLSEIQFDESTEIAIPSLQQVQWNLAMGMVLLHQHHYAKARALLEPTEARLDTIGYKRDQLKALVCLAACYLAEKQWPLAFQRLKVVEKILTSFDGYELRVLADLRVLPKLQQEIQKRPECTELCTLLHWQPKEQDMQKEPQKVVHQEAEIDITGQSASAALSLSGPTVVDAAPHLKILAFGEPVVLVDGEPITRWRMSRAMELCFYLLECRRPMRKEQLITALWEEVDEQVSQTFYSTIHYLRKALGSDATIRSKAGIYTLELASVYGQEGVWYDVAVFEEQYALGKQALADGADESARTAFEIMVELYRGDYVQPFYSDWCSFPRDKLQRAYLDARQQLAQLAWQVEKIDESVAHWQQMLAVDACLEEAHYGLMRGYIRQGKRGLALRQYQRCSEKLQQELGVLPGSAIQNLYRRLIGPPKVEAERS